MSLLGREEAARVGPRERARESVGEREAETDARGAMEPRREQSSRPVESSPRGQRREDRGIERERECMRGEGRDWDEKKAKWKEREEG